MKVSTLVSAAAMVAAISVAPISFAEDTYDYAALVKAMDSNKDGMVSKTEFMKKMDRMYDDMSKKMGGKKDISMADFAKMWKEQMDSMSR